MSFRLCACILLSAAAACEPDRLPPRDGPEQPTGLWLAPQGRWLAVTGGNWDERRRFGAVWWFDVERAAAAVEEASGGSGSGGCRAGPPVFCDTSAFVETDLTRFVPTGAGIPGGRAVGTGTGLDRLYVPVRDPPGVVWLDLDRSRPDRAEVACNEDLDGVCGDDHRLEASSSGNAFGSNPAAVVVDPVAAVAYVPHLLDGRLTLLGLDPVTGPFVADVESSFFREHPSDDFDLSGGFGVAVRPCDPAAPPLASRDCTRPTAVATHRYWPGFRNLSVAPGLSALLPGSDRPILAFDAGLFDAKPLTGGAAYVPGTGGTRLLVVSTTPPGLSEVDTSLDETGRPRDTLRRTVPVCRNPNHLAVTDGADGPVLAAVTCYGDDAVDLVALDTFSVVATVPVGRGPNHIVFDPIRGWLWVAGTLDDSLTVIDVRASRETYRAVVARFSG